MSSPRPVAALAALVAVAGCWTAPAAPVARAPGAVPPACRIADGAITAAGPVRLRQGGAVFATLRGPLTRLEVRLGDGAAAAEVEAAGVVLAGDLDVDALPARPRDLALHGGWLGIDRAHVARVAGARAHLRVELPAGVQPVELTVRVGCADLTFAAPARPDEDVAHVPWPVVAFAPFTQTPLATAPGGAQVALIAPEAAPVIARIRSRGPGQVFVQLRGANLVEGWVAAAAVGRAPPDDPPPPPLHAPLPSPGAALVCDHALPLYVTAPRGLRRVGHARPRAVLRVRDARDPAHVEIDLGAAELRVVARQAEALACRPAP